MRHIVGTGLEILQRALRPFVEAELRGRHGEQWRQAADASFPGEPPRDEFDVAALLQIIERNWSTVFVGKLTQNDRAAVGELRGVRNQWLHERPFTVPEVLHGLDAMQRLLRSTGHASEANDVARLKNGLAEPPKPAVRRASPSGSSTRTATRSAPAGRMSGSSSATASAPAPAPARVLPPAAVFAPAPPREPAARPSVADGPAAWAAEMDDIAEAFVGQFGRTFRMFGTPALAMLGITDAVAGVQWVCTRDLTTGRVDLAVNLEGMPYDGWPVARLIERELQDPQLPALLQTLPPSEQVRLHWMRDCWQGATRLKILEADIEPTPLTLDRLTPESWRQALETAQQCLDAERQFRGRGRQVVTTIASRTRAEKDVSPHLAFTTVVTSPGASGNWDAALRDPVARLEPLHAWLTDRASA